MTETERRVWSRLRSRQIGGYKFRRQVPVGPYFVDFLCISEPLAIEVDGPLHEDKSDQQKGERLRAAGYRLIRVPVNEVDESLDDVIHGIYLELTEPSLPVRTSPPGLPASGEVRAQVRTSPPGLPASGEVRAQVRTSPPDLPRERRVESPSSDLPTRPPRERGGE